MFLDRKDAAWQLAKQCMTELLVQPVIVSIPNGGVVVGAEIARQLGTGLDVIFSRKLRHPKHSELVMGAVCEGETLYLLSAQAGRLDNKILEEAIRYQLSEIEQSRQLVRKFLPQLSLEDRTVLLTDDGIANEAAAVAAIKALRKRSPIEIIVAVPVASPEIVDLLKYHADGVICLLTPDNFSTVKQFYQSFPHISDDEMIEVIKTHLGICEQVI